MATSTPMSTPVDDGSPDLIGATLPGGFLIRRHVAEGSMGHVYEARGPDGQRAAVKVLHRSLMKKPDVAFRFRHEAELLDAVKSPFVPKLLARGRDEHGRPFQVIEFVDGEELNAILGERVVLPYREAIAIAIQMCRALAVAHAAGIVHRDMKPENVIVDGYPDDPKVKVLDFSVSKEADLAFTQTGVILGTPSYMPPEQARGDDVTPLVDVYAVGAILYDMLVGRPPFEADEPGKVLANLLTREPPRPRDLNPNVSRAAEAVVMRAIARKPEDRYPSMAALIDALEKLSEETARQSLVSTLPPPPSPPPVDEGTKSFASVDGGPAKSFSSGGTWWRTAVILFVLVALGVVVALASTRFLG